VSTGIGKTQRRILDALHASENSVLTVIKLAEKLGLRDNQVRRAVHALADRELVVLTKEHARWAGVGQYGPLRRRDNGYYDLDTGKQVEYGPEVPTADFDSHWDELDRGWNRVEYVHAGMPTGVSLLVWTPEAAAAEAAKSAAFRKAHS